MWNPPGRPLLAGFDELVSMESTPMRTLHALVPLALTGLILSLGSVARGDITLYDNLNATSSGDGSVDDSGELADSFSTGSTAVTLTDVMLSLSALTSISPIPTGTTALDLLSDNSNSPGTLVTQLATFNNT